MLSATVLSTPALSTSFSSRPNSRPRTSTSRVAVVRSAAESKLPKGVTTPRSSPVQTPPKFGFVYNAERLNSRACMIGFFAMLLVEGLTNKALLSMIGLTVGEGLPFEL